MKMHKKNIITIVIFSLFVIIGLEAGILKQSQPQKTDSHVDSPTGEEKAFWKNKIAEIGGKEAYELLKTRYKRVPLSEQHGVAHLFGELLFQKEGLESIAVCDSNFAFGCYHSFYASALRTHGTKIVEELNAVCVKKFGPLGTGCQHGIGHGILEYTGAKKINEALLECDPIQRVPLLGCSSGVFMEYNSPLGGLQTKPLITKDGVSYCEGISDKFQASCYYELGQWLVLYQRSDEKLIRASKVCGVVSGIKKEYCYLGIGAAVVIKYDHSPKEAEKYCMMVPNTDSEISCRAGGTWSFFAAPDYRQHTPLLCQNLGENKATCIKLADLTQTGELNKYAE